MERSRILRRAPDLLRERNDELARLETPDTGKPLSETAAVEIATAVMTSAFSRSRPARAVSAGPARSAGALPRERAT